MLFLSGVCLPSLGLASGPLRTRQFLLFPFLACTRLPWDWRQGRSAHVSSCFFLFGVCLPSLGAASGPLRTRQLLLFPFWRVPAFPCSSVRAAPHTSALAFPFWRVPAFPWFGKKGAPHTPALAFSFFGVCTPSPGLAKKALRTRQLLLFPFWRVPALPWFGKKGAPHTSVLAFSFFGVCTPSPGLAKKALRTRQLLLFPFWRVPAFPCSSVRAAPHTSVLAFSFPACACLLLQRRQGRSAHVSSCFFLFGVCLRSLGLASGPLRTRQLLLFPFWRVPALPISHFKRIYKKYNIFLARLPSPCYNIDKAKGPSKASGLLAMPGCLIWDPHMYENAAVFRGV